VISCGRRRTIRQDRLKNINNRMNIKLKLEKVKDNNNRIKIRLGLKGVKNNNNEMKLKMVKNAKMTRMMRP
jgi:hypothetical protein